jgi:hypothetical protein
MTKDRIEIDAITIDASGRLLVRPSAPMTFEFIYRAACGVGWDVATRSLVSPAPEEWTYVDWFAQIHGAVAAEYGETLTTTSMTCWDNVPDELRDQINDWLQNSPAPGDAPGRLDSVEQRSRLRREETDRAAIAAPEAASRVKD